MANPTYRVHEGLLAVDGDELHAVCGCISRWHQGRWYVVKVCEDGARKGVQAYFFPDAKDV